MKNHGTLPEPPHPLAAALVAALPHDARVLLVGVGSGRHVPILLECGCRVDGIEADAQRASLASARFAAEPRIRIVRAPYEGPYPFTTTHDGALSTHALLHGTPPAIARALAAIGNRLRAGAPFHLTLGSRSDPRFALGEPLDDATRVAREGPEAGVPHAYFDEAGARALLTNWDVVELYEASAAETAGRWAHEAGETVEIVHWFVRIARR
ncbi:MAG: class I SAM-dependent methyltransferase [Candidatus Eremiobacteraeota bacterium]|nr:class I SAM-dependent methyltransferase [Candidatus Eremiobacteraeota bacterium]